MLPVHSGFLQGRMPRLTVWQQEDTMANSEQRRVRVAHGLAKAATHLAANNGTSGLALAHEAVARVSDAITLASLCRTSLVSFDAGAIELVTALAEPSSNCGGELAGLLGVIEAGPRRAIELARRLEQRGEASCAPVDGRILYLLHKSLPHANDGYAVRSHGLAKALQQGGSDLVCATRPGFPGDLGEADRSAGADRVDVIDGIAYHRLATPDRKTFSLMPAESMTHASFGYLEAAARRLENEMRAIRPAYVIAASNMATALPACLAARSLGLPFVYEVRGFWEVSRSVADPAYETSLTGRQERYLETALACAADGVVTLSQSMRAELMERGVPGDRITIVPNACDPRKFHPAPRNAALSQQLRLDGETPVIGYAGSFNEYEGLCDLVEACAILRGEGLDFRLVLVGSEPSHPEGHSPVSESIKSAVRDCGLADFVHMPGRVPHDEVARWYSLFDIAPFPRRPHLLTELVPPLKPLEALAMGKAVIVSSVSGMAETVRDGRTGLVFAAGSVNSLADALRLLLRSPARREALGAAGRKWIAEERCWDAVAKTMLQSLERINVQSS